MNRTPLPALALLVVCLCVGPVQAAEVYWDPSVSDAAEFLGDTDAEAVHSGRITQTPAAVQIYDSPDDTVDMTGDETEVPAVARPRQEAAPSAVRQQQPESSRRPSQTRQRQAPDTEQKATVQKPKKRKSGTPATTSTEEAETPESQRAKPGEVDVQPAEPKSKLQWGR